MSREGVFAGLRTNLFPQGELGEFWQGVSRGLVWFVLITGLWLGYSGVRIALSLSWEGSQMISPSRPLDPKHPSTASYSYMVDGVEYSGSRYYFGGNAISTQKPKDRRVFFDPKNPARSVVYRNFNSTHFAFLLLAIGAVFARRLIYRNYAR